MNIAPKKASIKADPWGNPDAPSKEPKTDKTEVKKLDCCVDSERLQKDFDAAISRLNNSGYEVHSIVPVISGAYSYQYRDDEISSSPRLIGNTEAIDGGVSYGYGYSFTDSLIVIARKLTG